MNNEVNPGSQAYFLQRHVPVPPGEHIVVSDPFIDDFIQSSRPQCPYGAQAAGMMSHNCHANAYTPSAPAPSFHYAQPFVADIPSGTLGRLFPGDQPVIVQNSISPTHPYIPPVFPCGLCRREILDNVQAVQCSLGCKFWFHRTCVCLSEESYQLLLKDPYAEWICEPCFETKRDTVDDGQYKIIRSDRCYINT